MKITLLGTGDAPSTPMIGCKCPACMDARNGGRSNRSRFSVLIEGDGHVLIDTSPDMRAQLLSANVSTVNGVIWTHPHYDHYAGFGDFYRAQRNVDVYGIKETLDSILDTFYFMSYKRHDMMLYEPFSLIGLEFTLLKVTHPPFENAVGVRVSNGDKTVIITGDMNKEIPEKSLKMMGGADLLIADALAPTFKLRKHMNAAQALALGKKLRAKQTVFTHVGHFYGPHDTASKKWPLGYDGMVFEF
ncbi:MAG: MBL fold metallo-hydrolase [Methanosarcinales archaeon]|nr:MAG: MBL fold metallo-hydrolase [Methanosarcinales archaeon]